MTLQELMTTTPLNPILEIIKNNYPLFYNYFATKYKEYTLKYSAPIFCDQLLAITQANSVELNAMEMTNTKLDMDNLGKVVTTNKNRTSKETNTNKDSYKGFNVSGDFAIKDMDKDLTEQDIDRTQELNYYEYLLNINNNKFRNNWANIEKEIASLFVLYFI